ncbi:hypothetical protein LTS18_006407 [Coniosporium uncinatum]|uniref:Uncharacterized protein n=1 Tax=Coniosporium uncinatum TaxID=93489 RepID=A0ACC3DCQ3_9PEZI|nr:hypothetical protein LTS18_006407 [Coniosporium uncinatum]
MQNVLLIPTGREAGLNARVNFDKVRSYSMPVLRDHLLKADDVLEAIRVPLREAIRFVAALSRREEAAGYEPHHPLYSDRRLSACIHLPDPQGDSYTHDNRPPYFAESADDYADTVIRTVDRAGYDYVYMTWVSVRRIGARERGEGFGDLSKRRTDDWV